MLGPGLRVKGGVSSVEKLIIDNCPGGMKIRHISTMEDGGALKKTLVFFRAILLLILQLSIFRPQAIHIHFASRGSTFRKVILMWISLFSGRPIVLHAHGAEYPLFFAAQPVFWQNIIRATFRRCAKFIVLSNSWREFYAAKLHIETAKIWVAPNPVQLPDSIPQRTNREQLTVLFMGRIGERKGTFDLIHAFAELLRMNGINAKLVVAGDGESEKARLLIDKLRLAAAVSILSWVGPREKEKLLNEADVLILPSYNEGLPMALLEGMAYGLPVIATPVGGIPELIRHLDNGVLVQPGNTEDIRKALYLLLSDGNLRVKMGMAAKESIRHLDVRKYAAALEDIYLSLNQAKNARRTAIEPGYVKKVDQ